MSEQKHEHNTKVPRMRTAAQAIAEIRLQDPDTALTERALRRWINEGIIPCTQIGTKKLINLDVLCDFLNNGTAQDTAAESHGKIRKVAA